VVIRPEPWRFYDGGVDAWDDQPEEPPNPDSDARVELIRMTGVDGGEQFVMMRRIGYLDRHLGRILVPRVTRTFRTDLTSVPALFTWLVPKTGAHLPAALVHDGLVHPPGDVTYTVDPPADVPRHEADRVLRDAMADTGTGVVRRWLVWSAVTAATLWSGEGTGWSRGRRTYYRAVVGLLLGAVAVLGVLATLDLLDVTWAWALPWMGERRWYVELAGGLAGAVVVPLALGLLWGRFRIAGVVVGVTLALLLHVTLALAALTGLYQVLERVAGRAPRLVLALGVVAGGAALGFFVGLLV
jgi:hypothetical protein